MDIKLRNLNPPDVYGVTTFPAQLLKLCSSELPHSYLMDLHPKVFWLPKQTEKSIEDLELGIDRMKETE